MKKRGIILGVFVFLSFSVAAAPQPAERSILLEMRKTADLGRDRISLIFNRLPEFSFESSGQRFDILLVNTRLSDGLVKPPEDETLVRILFAQKQQSLVTSLLLRRPPVQVVSTANEKPARLDFDLYWEEAGGTRPAIAFRIDGIPSRKGSQASGIKKEFPPWSEAWRDFFAADLTPWSLSPEMNFSLPELPQIDGAKTSESMQQRLALVKQKKWTPLLQQVADLPAVPGLEKPLETLLISEALLRTSALEGAEVSLRACEDIEGELRPRVDYLTDFALAANGHPYAANLKLQDQLKSLPAAEPFLPVMTLLAAETALATGENQQALSWLENKDIPWPEALRPLVIIRQATALAALEQSAEALQLLAPVAGIEKILDFYPAARATLAGAAFTTQNFERAARWYNRLAEQSADKEMRALAMFAAAVARYNAGDQEWARIGFQKIHLEMPQTQGADRALMRLQDFQILTGDEAAQAVAATQYAELAKHSRARALREEAAFKEALVFFILGDPSTSVQRLMKFRRDFAGGPLRPAADSLLLEQLPGVITHLIEQQEDLQAIVLVEQNRGILLQERLDNEFLGLVAAALTRLGLYDRATRVVLFQLDRAPSIASKEKFYLPLVRLYRLRRQNLAVVSQAQTYLKLYPKGESRSEIYSLMLDALVDLKGEPELLKQLERSDRPVSAKLEMRAAWIYWQQERLDAVVKRLTQATSLAGSLPQSETLLLAEALFQQQRNQEAAPLFKGLRQDPDFGAQASYRSAQLLLRQGETLSALNLLREFVDKDQSSPWSLLAQDLLKELNVTNF